MPIHWLGDTACHDPALVGGKAANLSRLASVFRVPPGFAVSGLRATDAMLASDVIESIRSAYATLAAQAGSTDLRVAVRSSALDEDGASASFAGQHLTLLNVTGIEAILDAVQCCRVSAGTDAALRYREAQGVATDSIEIAVLVQVLVPADAAAVAFSANPITGARDEVVISANWGLGESIVSGYVTPDTYIVRKSDGSIVTCDTGAKEVMTVMTDTGTQEVAVPEAMRARCALTDAETAEIARLAASLEAAMGYPVDIECALAGGDLYLLQCRPITRLPVA